MVNTSISKHKEGLASEWHMWLHPRDFNYFKDNLLNYLHQPVCTQRYEIFPRRYVTELFLNSRHIIETIEVFKHRRSDGFFRHIVNPEYEFFFHSREEAFRPCIVSRHPDSREAQTQPILLQWTHRCF